MPQRSITLEFVVRADRESQMPEAGGLLHGITDALPKEWWDNPDKPDGYELRSITCDPGALMVVYELADYAKKQADTDGMPAELEVICNHAAEVMSDHRQRKPKEADRG